MATEPRALAITLNKDGVTGPAMKAMVVTAELATIIYDAVDAADLNNSRQVSAGFTTWQFETPARTASHRRDDFHRFVFSKGIQEIARGIRQSLEEAYCYCEVLDWIEGRRAFQTTVGEYNQRITQARRSAGQSNFPDLLVRVNRRLSSPLQFDQEFSSLNKVRNCIEHRAGVVSAIDTGGAETLTLTLPRLKTFILIDDVEVELYRGLRIEEDSTVSIRRDRKTWQFPIGSSVNFSRTDLIEICVSSYYFISDLSLRLPDFPTGGGV